MITVRAAADACERILGGIPAVHVTTGSVAATVVLGDEPVISISPLQGQVLIATQTWLRARPKQSPTLLHSNVRKDEDWHYCTTSSFRDLCYALHLAVPALEHRATLPQRIAAKLGGVPQRRLAETDPRYWLALARWIDGSGLLTRNDAKFSRIYAKQLRRGMAISEAFRAWAIRTSAAAIGAGFPASEPVEIPRDLGDDHRIEGEAGSDRPVAGSGRSVPVPEAVKPLVDQLSQLDAAQISAIGSAPVPDADQATQIRAAVIRAGARDIQRAAKGAVAEAVLVLRDRFGSMPALDRLAVMAADTAAALVVRESLDSAIVAAALEPWERATGSQFE